MLQEVLHQLGSETKFLSIFLLSICLEQQTANEHGCQERRNDTNHIGYSEALDRTCTEDSQDCTSQE